MDLKNKKGIGGAWIWVRDVNIYKGIERGRVWRVYGVVSDFGVLEL